MVSDVRHLYNYKAVLTKWQFSHDSFRQSSRFTLSYLVLSHHLEVVFVSFTKFGYLECQCSVINTSSTGVTAIANVLFISYALVIRVFFLSGAFFFLFILWWPALNWDQFKPFLETLVLLFWIWLHLAFHGLQPFSRWLSIHVLSRLGNWELV